MRDETEYWEIVAGTRLDIGTTAIEYVGEFDWVEDDSEDLNDESLSAWVLNLPNDRVIHMSEVEAAGGAFIGTRSVAAEWQGITFDTMNTGYLIRMTNDEQGAYVARHWGK